MSSPAISPAQLADQRSAEIVHAQQHAWATVVDSPPGAGKTGVVERLAIHSAWVRQEKVIIATQTNAQAMDLADRLASNWKTPVHLLTRADLPIPAEVLAHENLVHVTEPGQLLEHEGPQVVVSNSRKWSFVQIPDQWFDLMVVEEAYQLRDAEFMQIASFAQRYVLVGDPGQIDPVTSCDITRWSASPSGPHVPAPVALLRRHPGSVHLLKLPVSRRLPEDTVQIVQPAFYPSLPFSATSQPEDRRLLPGPGSGDAWDGLIDLAAEGRTLLLGELPDRITGEMDTGVAEAIVLTISRLLERGTRVRDFEFKPESEREVPLTPGQIGVVCGHRSQVSAIQERISRLQEHFPSLDLADILVETSDRFQGLERQVMLVHHPLSGRISAQDFHLDSGRLCVMLSRHRVACFIFGRQGMLGRLQQQEPAVKRILAPMPDRWFEGQSQHEQLLALLHHQDRVRALPEPS